MNDWKSRLIEEATALDIRIEHLAAFIEGEQFARLEREDMRDLRLQLMYMQHYSNVLARRLMRARQAAPQD